MQASLFWDVLPWLHGGGNHLVMQLCGYYAEYLAVLGVSSIVAQTILPANSLEVYGNGIK